jgi:4-amino-4-deoxy-L-arabinose transferase-like glycosyltransferase
MEMVMTWGMIVPVVTFFISAGLVLVIQFGKWADDSPAPESSSESSIASKTKEPAKLSLPKIDQIKLFVGRYRWELALALAVGAILLFALVWAPPRIDNKIPLNPLFPGRPFYSLHWIRNYVRDHYNLIWSAGSSLFILCSLLLVGRAIQIRSRSVAELALLVASLNLAFTGQWTVNANKLMSVGVIFYIFAAAGFAGWAWSAKRRVKADFISRPLKRSTEIWVVLGLLTLTAFGRLYALKAIPYGIEGDEAKWTAEAVDLGIRGKYDSSGEFHRDALPVSYYIQMPLQRLMGPGILPARLTVALLSITATLVFYWLLRQIAPVPLAALSAYLLGSSIFDISASRLANVESFVKLWPILTLALLMLAIRKQRWQIYGFSGLALALGMLTYDTVWPIFLVTLLLAITELIRQHVDAKFISQSLAALITPTLLALPMLIPYALSRTEYYDLSSKGWNGNFWDLLGSRTSVVIQTWFVDLRSDFIYNRSGPLLNAILLPWLVLGLVAGFFLIRQRYNSWNLLWLALLIFPVPVITDSQLGRVYYPGLPAVYAMIGLGIFLFWNEVNRFLGKNARPLLISVSLVPLIWFPLFNQFVYYNEVPDATDRQMRREIGELVAQAASPDTLIFLPVVLKADEPLNNEYQMVEMFMLQKVPSNQIGNSHKYVALTSLLPDLTGNLNGHSKAAVVMDKTTSLERDVRDQIAASLTRCFPGVLVTKGSYFDLYQFDQNALHTAICKPAELTLQFKPPRTLTWNLSAGTARRIDFTCQLRKTDFTWIEAETLSLAPGWQNEVNFATGWEGTGFISDSYKSQYITIDFPNRNTKELYLWIRYYKRVLDHSPGQVTIAGQTEMFADVEPNQLNRWVWQRLGPFRVEPDTNLHISLNRPYTDDPQHFMALFIDSFVVTGDPELSPESNLYFAPIYRNFPYMPALPIGSIDTSQISQLDSSHYRCQATAISDDPIVDVFGNSPVISNELEFEVIR